MYKLLEIINCIGVKQTAKWHLVKEASILSFHQSNTLRYIHIYFEWYFLESVN